MDFSDNNQNNKEVLEIFRVESEEILDRLFNNLFALEDTPANKDIIGVVYRDLHSLKGAVRMVGFNNIQMILHKMEDFFDSVNNNKILLDANILKLMNNSLEAVSKYLQDSIRNAREIIDESYTTIISNLEFLMEQELEGAQTPDENAKIASLAESDDTTKELAKNQEEINTTFNNCFEIIDGIVPEEESQDIVILKEEVQKIYEFFKGTNLYEVKNSLENILTKLDFVMNATNTLTISEILELRNELSSAAAKFTTSCIET